MEKAIATVSAGPLSKEQVVAQKSLVRQVMESVMKENTHYGVIPGCKQPSLYKAGSEAILATFRIAVLPVVEDLSTYDCYRYRVTCKGVLPNGEVVGSGVGECSTDEDKYKWRGVVCEAEFEDAAEDRRRIKYVRPNNYNKDGRVKQIRTNPADLANTVLKMAKKRAQIDLTLTCTACSDVFVQDLEDLSEELREELVGQEAPRTTKPEVKQPEAKPQPAASNGDKVTEGQVKMLFVKMRQGNVTEEDFKAHYGINSVSELPRNFVNEAIKAIGEGLIQKAKKETHANPGLPTICSDCGEPIVEGACRNLDCPEGKEMEP